MARPLLAPLGLVVLSSPPADPQAGDSYFDSTLGKWRFYTGSAWTEAH